MKYDGTCNLLSFKEDNLGPSGFFGELGREALPDLVTDMFELLVCPVIIF